MVVKRLPTTVLEHAAGIGVHSNIWHMVLLLGVCGVLWQLMVLLEWLSIEENGPGKTYFHAFLQFPYVMFL